MWKCLLGQAMAKLPTVFLAINLWIEANVTFSDKSGKIEPLVGKTRKKSFFLSTYKFECLKSTMQTKQRQEFVS